MPNCSVLGCVNRSDRKSFKVVSYHRFPSEQTRRNEWLKAINRETWNPSKYAVICSEHFREDCFDRSGNIVKLRSDAIPLAIHLQEQQPGSPVMVNLDVAGPSSTPMIKIQSTSSSTGTSSMDVSMTGPITETPRKRRLRSQLESARKRIRYLQQKSRRLNKRLSTSREMLKHLKKKKLIDRDDINILTNINVTSRELFLKQVEKVEKRKRERTYSPALRKFALTLNFYSPKAYQYVRKVFDTCLPHIRTIARWYSSINGKPGFTSESFTALRLRQKLKGDKKMLCNLTFDEMAIRKHVETNGQEFFGFIDMGEGCDIENVPVASQALTFLLTAINDQWKVPIGYFFIDSVSGEQKKNLLLNCLLKTNDAGVKVTSITFDGLQSNLTMVKILGCSIEDPLKTNFQHPTTKENIYIFLDMSHVIKLVRNAFANKRVLIDSEGKRIEWHLIERLQKLQDEEGLRLGNKLTKQHIYFQRQIMKVKLATQLFSNSVADALLVCNTLGLEGFEDVQGTVQFIRIMNNLFDIFNSKHISQLGFKKPISEKNANDVFKFFDTVDKYIKGLKIMSTNEQILMSKRRTGFIGIRINMNSLRLMYDDMRLNQKLSYIPTHKLSQDHVELFFCTIRSAGGFNNNPTVRQFTSAYKKLLIHTELKESSNGNCVPLENINILNATPKSDDPIQIINDTADRRRISDIVETINICSVENEYMKEHSYAFNTNLSEFAEQVVTYIAGFIVHTLSFSLKCEICINAITNNKKENVLFSLISKKDRGGLKYPSHSVLKICMAAEDLFRKVVKQDSLKLLNGQILTTTILKTVLQMNIFEELYSHNFEQEVLSNHRVNLIRSIAQKYLSVKINYYTKNVIDHSKSLRTHYNKLILFQGF